MVLTQVRTVPKSRLDRKDKPAFGDKWIYFCEKISDNRKNRKPGGRRMRKALKAFKNQSIFYYILMFSAMVVLIATPVNLTRC